MNFDERVEHGLKGVEHVSTGHCPDCLDCPDCDEDCDEDCGDEGGFSWEDCDCCGSSLGGNRYPAHGIAPGLGLIHLEVCEDCLLYLANGDLPEE